MFITAEGCEASGKSTQIKLLTERLINEGYQVVTTREPGGSSGAEEIRSLLLSGDTTKWSAKSELLLFTAARNDHLEKVIKPALEKGKIVICDRYVGSTYALQGAGGMNVNLIKSVCDLFNILKPDLTLYLDIDPKTSFERINKRFLQTNEGKNRMENKGFAYHCKVAELFEKQFEENIEWIKFDAKKSVKTLHEEIYSCVKSQI